MKNRKNIYLIQSVLWAIISICQTASAALEFRTDNVKSGVLRLPSIVCTVLISVFSYKTYKNKKDSNNNTAE
jgi:hypothetical protein